MQAGPEHPRAPSADPSRACAPPRCADSPKATRSSRSPTLSSTATARRRRACTNTSTARRRWASSGTTRASSSTRRAASAPTSRIGSSRCALGRPAPAAAARARAACRLSVPRSLRLSPQWALGALDLIYAHEGTTIFRLIDSAPPTRPSYFQSGWTNYESGPRPRAHTPLTTRLA